uniref:Uncharacterized protein n=1 Tax=Romanomermis culicivorax TaxID=13658 RepID=A0A915KU06_ROMCU
MRGLCRNLAPMPLGRSSYIGANLTLAPVSLWRASHFGAGLTLAPCLTLVPKLCLTLAPVSL